MQGVVRRAVQQPFPPQQQQAPPTQQSAKKKAKKSSESSFLNEKVKKSLSENLKREAPLSNPLTNWPRPLPWVRPIVLLWHRHLLV